MTFAPRPQDADTAHTPGTATGYSLGGSLSRIGAMVLRHLYLMRSSWPRVIEMVYWPTMQMMLWGFITIFLMDKSDWLAQASGVLLSGLLLWEILFRSQLGVSLAYLEEVWARNLASLLVSPLRPAELVASMVTLSLIRTLIGVSGAALLAYPLYHYNLFEMGWGLIAFFANLMVMGWSVGLLVSSLIMRFGLGAESLAWAAIFIAQPLSGIYYPVSVLPDWMQVIAAALPSSHVFEGMRAVLLDDTFRWDLLANAMLLNAVYLAVSGLVFMKGIPNRPGARVAHGRFGIGAYLRLDDGRIIVVQPGPHA